MRKLQTLRGSTTLAGVRFKGHIGLHGFPMRDPEGHESGAETNNQGGNDGNSQTNNANGTSPQNNTGSSFDPSAFWNSPQEENSSPSNGGSAGGSNPGGTQNQNQNEGNAFAQALGNLQFGQGVFTADAVQAMNDGNPETFNQNMTNFGREVTKQAVILAAQLMQRNNEQLNQRFESMVEERFGTRDTETDLSKEIPSYTKPGMKPIVDGIMAQALRLTKGKRTEAIAMTKEMLKFQATNLGSDFNITTPPGGPGNDFGTGPTTDWAAELLGRD